MEGNSVSNLDLTILNAQLELGLPLHLAQAVASGTMRADDAQLKNTIYQHGFALRGIPNAEWPTPNIVWDLSPENFHLCADGKTPAQFQQAFPDATIMHADVERLHARMATGSKRTEGPFDQKYRDKTATLVAHLEAGQRVTPPLIRPSGCQLVIEGGHHRFGYARHRSQGEIPILVLKVEMADIQAILRT